jgi:hypothetical protein
MKLEKKGSHSECARPDSMDDLYSHLGGLAIHAPSQKPVRVNLTC